jgi:MSHA biogenesis protein MshJ
MPALLEAILKRDGRLRLISMKTLPVSTLGATPAVAAGRTGADAAAPLPAAASLSASPDATAEAGIASIYRHGVEITVAGTYPDMLHYMTQLEAMPWQLYWGEARLQAESYPQALLTLTLFTLSLDKKWMNL